MIKKKYFIGVVILLVVSYIFNAATMTYHSNMVKELKVDKTYITTVENNLNDLKHENAALVESISVMTSELESANVTISELKNIGYKLVYLGNFKLTHYCNEQYEHICGNGDGITSTGSSTNVGTTIAVDPKVIPYGTKVYIEGYGWRVAEDCGGGVNQNHVDILVDTHAQALSMGTTHGGVWILVQES